jgi:hypothetical protein
MCSMSLAGSCRILPLVAFRVFGFHVPVGFARQWLGLQHNRSPHRFLRYEGSSPVQR